MVDLPEIFPCDQLYLGHDAVFVTEVYAGLGLGHAPDQGPGDGQLPHHQPDLVDGVRLEHETELDQDPAPGQQRQIGVQVVISRHLSEENINLS